MKYEIKIVNVSHEAILALHLHEQCLAQDYERLIRHNGNYLRHINKLAEIELKKRISDCQIARLYLEKNFINCEDVVDKTEY